MSTPDQPVPDYIRALNESRGGTDVSFEVALDAIGLVIAVCTARYWEARNVDKPDPAEVAQWDHEITEAVREQQALRADDPVAIARTTEVFSQRLRVLLSSDQ